jgi:hypothetical protein
MKHQYFGDLSDYAKYSILRAMARGGFRVAVCWMLTLSDGRTDGQQIAYAANRKCFRGHDPELFDLLANSLVCGERNVSIVERSGLLGNCAFYGAELEASLAARSRYFDRLWDVAAGNDAIFFDPDNGWEVPSVRRGQTVSPKYLYWDEFDETLCRGYSALVYQHFPRVPRMPFVQRLLEQVVEREVGAAFALTTPNVAFVFAAQERHRERLWRAAQLVQTRWRDHFQLISHGAQEGLRSQA